MGNSYNIIAELYYCNVSRIYGYLPYYFDVSLLKLPLLKFFSKLAFPRFALSDQILPGNYSEIGIKVDHRHADYWNLFAT